MTVFYKHIKKLSKLYHKRKNSKLEICHLQLFLHKFPEIMNIWSDVTHDAINVGNVRGINLLVSWPKMNPEVPGHLDITSSSKR